MSNATTYCSCGHILADHPQDKLMGVWHAPCMQCGCDQFDDDWPHDDDTSDGAA